MVEPHTVLKPEKDPYASKNKMEIIYQSSTITSDWNVEVLVLSYCLHYCGE